jgi:transposase
VLREYRPIRSNDQFQLVNARILEAYYVEHVLSPALWPGWVVVMDDLTVLKGERAREPVEERGRELSYLPPYILRPTSVPQEETFSKIKAPLRKKPGLGCEKRWWRRWPGRLMRSGRGTSGDSLSTVVTTQRADGVLLDDLRLEDLDPLSGRRGGHGLVYREGVAVAVDEDDRTAEGDRLALEGGEEVVCNSARTDAEPEGDQQRQDQGYGWMPSMHGFFLERWS